MPHTHHPGLTPEMLSILTQFRVLLRSIDLHYRAVEEKCGLGGAQLWALTEIAAHPEASMGELARRLAVHLSTASNLVSRLESLGLVKRNRDRKDQRVVVLAATPAGIQRLRKAPSPSVGLLQEALLAMPGERVLGLEEELDCLLRHMRRLDKGGRTMLLADQLAQRGPGNAPAPKKRPRRPRRGLEAAHRRSPSS